MFFNKSIQLSNMLFARLCSTKGLAEPKRRHSWSSELRYRVPTDPHDDDDDDVIETASESEDEGVSSDKDDYLVSLDLIASCRNITSPPSLISSDDELKKSTEELSPLESSSTSKQNFYLINTLGIPKSKDECENKAFEKVSDQLTSTQNNTTQDSNEPKIIFQPRKLILSEEPIPIVPAPPYRKTSYDQPDFPPPPRISELKYENKKEPSEKFKNISKLIQESSEISHDSQNNLNTVLASTQYFTTMGQNSSASLHHSRPKLSLTWVLRNSSEPKGVPAPEPPIRFQYSRTRRKSKPDAEVSGKSGSFLKQFVVKREESVKKCNVATVRNIKSEDRPIADKKFNVNKIGDCVQNGNMNKCENAKYHRENNCLDNVVNCRHSEIDSSSVCDSVKSVVKNKSSLDGICAHNRYKIVKNNMHCCDSKSDIIPKRTQSRMSETSKYSKSNYMCKVQNDHQDLKMAKENYYCETYNVKKYYPKEQVYLSDARYQNRMNSKKYNEDRNNNGRWMTAPDEYCLTSSKRTTSEPMLHGERVRVRQKRRSRSRLERKLSRFGYDIEDVDAFLTKASLEKPANIPVVLSFPSVLYQTQYNGYQDEIPLPLGMVVNAIFKKESWLYIQTPHGEEGYVNYTACLPLGIIPQTELSSKDTPCWENSTDIFPHPCGNMTDTEKLTQSECGGSKCRRRVRRSAVSTCGERSVDRLYLRAAANAKSNRSLKRQTLLVVDSDFVGRKKNTLTVSAGDVVALISAHLKDWFWVRARDGSEGFIPAEITGHGFL